MQTVLLRLSEEILGGGARGLQANSQFRQLINEVSNLQACLAAMQESDSVLFVYCTNMIKLVESGDFSIVSETRSEENILSMVEGSSQKAKTYGHILMTLAHTLLRKTGRHSYIVKSVLDLMSLCLKALFEDNNNLQFLQALLHFLLPAYRLDESFNTTIETPLQVLEPRCELEALEPTHYAYCLQVFTSMMEYITVQSGLKTYYEYRRNIYVFRNSYLAHFLQFAVEASKLLFPRVVPLPALRPVLAATLVLLEHIFMYPFTLSLHEFEIEEDLGENTTGLNTGDIYFANYFRHVLCDMGFLNDLLNYYTYVIRSASEFQDCRAEVYSLVKILGRVACPSQYTFKNDEERQCSRQFSLTVLSTLCCAPRFFDSYMFHTILDVSQKILLMFDSYFQERKPLIMGVVLNFLHHLMCYGEVAIEEGKRSSFARTFEILGVCLEHAKEKLEEPEAREVRGRCQQILLKAYERISGPEAVGMVMKFGYNQPTEIECFSELYEFIIPVFEAALQENLMVFAGKDVASMSHEARVMWLHLCSHLLPKTQSNLEETQIILKYYGVAQEGDSLASLRYIKTLVEEILSECVEGVSATGLWRNIQQLSGGSFTVFIEQAIKLCIANFKSHNSEIIDYSLEFFKAIFFNLRKNDHPSFLPFYDIVGALLSNIRATVFAHPTFAHKRRAFFNAISLIWVNTDNLTYLYQIHAIVAAPTATPHPTPAHATAAFHQYLHDITGIIEPVEKHEAFQVIAELALEDLEQLFSVHLGEEGQIRSFFSDAGCLKIFTKLGLAFVADLTRKLYYETHTDIPYRIHRLLHPYLQRVVEGGYELPRAMAQLLGKMVGLNPLGELVGLGAVMGQLRGAGEECDKLVRSYFDHIQRVGDIGWMYALVEQNVDFMVSWWEEAINRDLHPAIDLTTIAEARIWTTTRQRQSLAKLIFEVATYDPAYWNVAHFQGEREFVNKFAATYA